MRHLLSQMMQNKSYKGVIITPAHVLAETLNYGDVTDYLESYSCDVAQLKRQLKSLISGGANPQVPTVITQSLDTILSESEKITTQRSGANVSPDFKTFLFCVINHGQNTGESEVSLALQAAGFDFNTFLEQFQQLAQTPAFDKKENSKDKTAADICTNLNEEAKLGRITKVIGRDDEVLKILEILSKTKKNNAVLLGKAGVGKTAIAEALALAVVNGTVPASLKNMLVLNLEVANLISGTAYRGDFEKKVMNLLKEVKKLESEGQFVVLFIDELHSIMGTADFANIIKPALSKGEFRVVGATTDAEWHKFINTDKALKRRFTQIHIEEPTKVQAVEILKGAKSYYESKHGVTYSEESLVTAVDLSVEFITDSALPDKALDLLDLTGSIFKLKGQTALGSSEIEHSICRMRGLSLEGVRSKKVTGVVEPMNPKIKNNLFGQDHAVDEIVKTVEKSLAGLQDDTKPMGQFLLVGPTGVGKTELAKLLAVEMKAHLERIDMSEYMEQHSISKLIGAPPGYIGFDQQGRLGKAINKHPRCVLVLDEVEKAHPRVLDIFLQAMDNARVTDAQGEEIKFNNVLILMTSNTGARDMNERKVGLAAEKFEEKKINQNAIKDSFTPEFLNRLSGIIEFKSLSKDFMVNIVKKFVKKLNDGKLVTKGIKLELTPESEQWIVDETYDPTMGGRPIERGVDKYITQKITESILYGDLKNGKTQVKVVVENDELKFEYA